MTYGALRRSKESPRPTDRMWAIDDAAILGLQNLGQVITLLVTVRSRVPASNARSYTSLETTMNLRHSLGLAFLAAMISITIGCRADNKSSTARSAKLNASTLPSQIRLVWKECQRNRFDSSVAKGDPTRFGKNLYCEADARFDSQPRKFWPNPSTPNDPGRIIFFASENGFLSNDPADRKPDGHPVNLSQYNFEDSIVLDVPAQAHYLRIHAHVDYRSIDERDVTKDLTLDEVADFLATGKDVKVEVQLNDPTRTHVTYYFSIRQK